MSEDRLHYHVIKSSRDCDGVFDYLYTADPMSWRQWDELVEGGDVYEARDLVTQHMIPGHVHPDYPVSIEIGFKGDAWCISTARQTEEGWEKGWATECTGPCYGERPSQRDYTAERMGY